MIVEKYQEEEWDLINKFYACLRESDSLAQRIIDTVMIETDRIVVS